ncbi:hypothetical protein APC62_09690 [Acinetobacter pittii]|uniref:hypothetical protein n=1 Tax=Acinetobacter pittii TaxID=48296 RepID=UPI00070FBC09|nr:hypothetical protein APC62_09690 [Acinetobacter pittii]
MNLYHSKQENFSQTLISKDFLLSPKYEGKNMVFVFDREDSFNLTYDELLEIISKARMTGPQMIPILGTIGD